MKRMTIITELLLFVLMIGGCQSGETAKTGTAENGAKASQNVADANKANVNKADATSSGLNPENIDLDKPIPVGDLKNAVTANLNAWKGKEVATVGTYISNAPTTDGKTGKLLSVQVNLMDANKKIAVACVTDKEMPKDYLTQRENRVVKGKIKELTSFGQVKLEPCQCVK